MPTKSLKPSLRERRAELKLLLIGLLGNRCEHPSCPNLFVMNPALHECLVPFDKIQKVSNQELDELLALHIANVMLLCNEPCHLNFKPGTEETLSILRSRLPGFYKGFGFPTADVAILDFQNRLNEMQEKGVLKTRLGSFV